MMKKPNVKPFNLIIGKGRGIGMNQPFGKNNIGLNGFFQGKKGIFGGFQASIASISTFSILLLSATLSSFHEQGGKQAS